MDIKNLTIASAAKMLKEKKITSVELTKLCLKNIEDTKHLNTLIYLSEETALKQAEQADAAAHGHIRPLSGIPIVVKDNISVSGMPMSCGSKVLDGYYPPYDAAVTQKLREAGAVILGKANMDELAMGSSNETSAFGAARNPLDVKRVPGGSSGGSAAAVAASQCLGAYGTDTGGSVRQPAALCGLVGVKPTYGSVPGYGIIPLASSLDQTGVLAKDVADASILLSCVTGRGRDFNNLKPASLKGKKIAVIKEFSSVKVEKEVEEAFHTAVKFFMEAGARIIEKSLPYVDVMMSVYGVISSAEAASNFKKLHELTKEINSENLGAEAKSRLLFGNYILREENYQRYFLQAARLRTLIVKSIKDIFTDADAIITPTTPSVAFALGVKKNHTERRLADVFLTVTNLTGVPSISLPCKNVPGLPAGLQIITNNGCEREMFELALAYEKG